MPYIKPERRYQICESGKYIDMRKIENAGDLQYAIAELIHHFLLCSPGKFNYQKCNDVMGALNGANQEFYRVVVAPYEDAKISENGSVYCLDRYTNPVLEDNDWNVPDERGITLNMVKEGY
jgi:hypothetical protein